MFNWIMYPSHGYIIADETKISEFICYSFAIMSDKNSNSNTIPAEALPHTYEAFIHRIRPNTLAIYWMALLFLLMIFAALPFVYLSVDVSAGGILSSVAGNQEIFAPVSGKLGYAHMQDNQVVEKGELLANIENTVSIKRKSIIEKALKKTRTEQADLSVLLQQDFSFPPNKLAVRTATYTLAYTQAYRRFAEKSTHTKLVLKAFQRQEALYKAGVIAAKELEQERLILNKSEDELLQIRENYKLEWQSAHEQKTDAIRDLTSSLIELDEEMNKLAIRAPVSGSLQVPVGITQGVFVSAGSLLARLSPDTLLLADCYVSPADIGLIKEGQTVRFQVAAFNYNEWGLLKGKVMDISHDVVLVGESQPMFKVRCSIAQNYLSLKNEYKGYLKKGMTLQGRFLVTERSVYHLLFDKVDDWLNPYQRADR